MKTSSLRVTSLLIVALAASSCVGFQRWQKGQTQQLRQIELEDVAKSWCQTIRASQVVPVYPLTEDIQPGDVFLVQSTIDEQHKEYTKRGFLPLDVHLGRLPITGYHAFYERSILPTSTGTSDDPKLPASWMRPGGEMPAAGEAWKTAARAAFPSYSFSVKSGGGFSLAIPISGVPVGMSLMASQAASGTVNLSDARTYGLDTTSVAADLDLWAQANRGMLADYASAGENKSYLRVLTRVYLVGGVDVSLSSSSSAGAGLDAGVAQPVPATDPTPPPTSPTPPGTTPAPDGDGASGGTDEETTPSPTGNPAEANAAQAYVKNLGSINDSLGALNEGAGGSLRVTAAGAGTVSMRETFDPPLVLGYLGFDREILPGGVLGPACPTRITLEQPGTAKRLANSNRAVAIHLNAIEAQTVDLIRAAADSGELPSNLQKSAEAVLADLDALATTIPTSTYVYSATGGPGVVRRRGFAVGNKTGYDAFTSFRAALANSAQVVAMAEDSGQTLQVMNPGETAQPAPAGSTLRKQVDEELAASTALLEKHPWQAAEEKALRAARLWFASF